MKPRLSRPQFTLLYVAGWLPLLALYTVAMRQAEAPDYGRALVYAANYLAPGLALGALGWCLSGRIPWRGWRVPRILATEFALVAAHVALWHALFYAWIATTIGAPFARELAARSLGWQITTATLIAAIHAAVFHLVRIFGELREREIAAAEAETARTRAEMLALRGQLDPHFLFNSLHSITALVRTDAPLAEEALLRFSALLRRVLDVNRDTADAVPLSEELRFVEDYLAIERLRLGERLRLTAEILPESLACALPAFSVQALVENALRHAVAPRRDGGTVTLRAAVRAGRLEVSVSDDGPGADPAAVASASGVGLAIIRRRLHLLHGDRAALTIATSPGQGFTATLSLPLA